MLFVCFLLTPYTLFSFSAWFPLPSPRAWVIDQWTTPGIVKEAAMTLSTLVLLICRGPSSVSSSGATATI